MIRRKRGEESHPTKPETEAAPSAGPGGEPSEGPSDAAATGDARRPESAEASTRQADSPQEVAEAQPPSIPLEQHQRLLAEFDNYRKRIESQQERTGRWARADLMARLLPLLDDFERAREALTPETAQRDLEGTLIILGRLAEALKREGLERIAASPGMAFDPEVHEAVLAVPTDAVAAGSIAEVLQAGYRAGDRLLRPARVTVARAAVSDEAQGAEAPA